MARADLISELVRLGLGDDKMRFRKVVEAIIAEEHAKKHSVLASQLEASLRSRPSEIAPSSGTTVDVRISALLLEVLPELGFSDLVLPREILAIADEIVQEHLRADLLRSFGLEPRNRILLMGPPGNGKTSIAEAFAKALMVPMLVVRYDGVVGAYLGETAARLRRIIEYASTRHCVLFLDEFETLGKERGDRHETGEIKRVVSSLLLQIDALPSRVVAIAATNHAELLDRAVWRRFQVRMTVPGPTRASLMEWFARFEGRAKLRLGLSPEVLATKLAGSSFAEVEEFGSTVLRRFILAQPEANMKEIVRATLKGWPARSIRSKQQE